MTQASDGATRRVTVDAPAKINFGLRVVARRPDGYHQLESLFLPLDLRDELDVEVRESDRTSVHLTLDGAGAGVPADDANLAVRAARAFFEAAGLTCDVRVRLEKRIPAAAGLGGGSSDAGAMFRALASLFPGALESDRLFDLALGLGADVPFFLDPRPARVTGIGERIEPLPTAPALRLVLANPGVPLRTADVFRAHDVLAPSLTEPRPPLTLPAPLESTDGETGRDTAFASALTNDLEPPAVRLCPPISRMRSRLHEAGARWVGMSGSGPTLFGILPEAGGEDKVLAAMGIEAPEWGWVAATLESR